MQCETNVRKHWLISFFIFEVFNLGLNTILGMYYAYLLNATVFSTFATKSLITLPFQIIFASFLYYCAYKKRGTILLTLFTFFLTLPTSLLYLVSIFIDIKKILIKISPSSDYYIVIVKSIPSGILTLWCILCAVITIYFGFNCYLLRKINKQLKQEKTNDNFLKIDEKPQQ